MTDGPDWATIAHNAAKPEAREAEFRRALMERDSTNRRLLTGIAILLAILTAAVLLR